MKYSKDQKIKSFLATIQFVPRKNVTESEILSDIGAILDEKGYECFGLVALTEDVTAPSSDRIDFVESFNKHREALASLIKRE